MSVLKIKSIQLRNAIKRAHRLTEEKCSTTNKIDRMECNVVAETDDTSKADIFDNFKFSMRHAQRGIKTKHMQNQF